MFDDRPQTVLVTESPALAGAFVDAATSVPRPKVGASAALRDLVALAYTDELTGLPNRRYLVDRLGQAVTDAHSRKQPLSVLALDIDRFKQINDRYGHRAGDRVLAEFAKVLRTSSRSTDLMGRWGGEEFLYILPSPLASAEAHAERVREAVAAFPFGAPDLDLRLTVSIGVTELLPSEAVTDLVDRADWLLYQAKDEGRDRAVSGIGLSLYRWAAGART